MKTTVIALCLLTLAAFGLIVCAALPASQVQEAAALSFSSGLPVLSIVTEGGALPEADMLNARMTAHMPDGSRQEGINIGIRLRGNTSKRFPKKSYRVTIFDEEGNKRNLSVAGLRSDDDWILNPMYGDTSKIREALAYELWEAMNSSGVSAASSRLSYAEVYFNGEYWGLYGIQERIDRKQVGGDKRSGVLYKVATNDRPTVQELLDCESDAECRGFELDYAGTGVDDVWEPAAAYMALLNGEEGSFDDVLDVNNLIDYGLWAMLTQAHDCHFKNQFLNCVYDGDSYRMYKIPWDLNNTFGDIFRNDAEDLNHTLYSIGDLVMDCAFEVLIDANLPEANRAIQERWNHLRKTVIQQEALLARARALYMPLYDALERDTQRWPGCGMGDGNALNIRDIENYFAVMLPRMDRFVAGLETGA